MNFSACVPAGAGPSTTCHFPGMMDLLNFMLLKLPDVVLQTMFYVFETYIYMTGTGTPVGVMFL